MITNSSAREGAIVSEPRLTTVTVAGVSRDRGSIAGALSMGASGRFRYGVWESSKPRTASGKGWWQTHLGQPAFDAASDRGVLAALFFQIKEGLRLAVGPWRREPATTRISCCWGVVCFTAIPPMAGRDAAISSGGNANIGTGRIVTVAL